MADVTIAQFADVLKVPVDRLIAQLDQAGITVSSPEELISEESLDQSMPADDLLTLEGMRPDLALALARRGVRTREELADQAIDDIADIEGLSSDEAGSLIMKARAHWFEAQH